MMNYPPKVSVLMPVYNQEKYVQEAVESVLQQTYTHFELLIFDDGSTDQTPRIIEKLAQQDRRISLHKHETKKGLPYTRNRLFALATGTYWANLDSDDVALPERLQRQVAFLEQHPQVAVCGTYVDFFTDTPHKILHTYTPVKDADTIKCRLLFHNTFANPSVMFRRESLEKLTQWYDEDLVLGSDYELFARLSHVGELINLPEVLQKMREHPHRSTHQYRNTNDLKTIFKKIIPFLHIFPTEAELCIHESLAHTQTALETPILAYLQSVDAWLRKIQQANAQHNVYPEPALTHYLQELWLRHMAGKAGVGKDFYRLFAQSPLSPYRTYNLWQKAKFWIKFVFFHEKH